MQIAGSKELFEQVFDRDLCSVCGACVGICPYFKVHGGKVAKIFDCDLEQGSCYAHCPKTGVDFEKLSNNYFSQSYSESALGTYQRIVAAKAGGTLTGNQFQNGGTVTALVVAALEKNLIEGAVLTGADGLLPVPKIAKSTQEILACVSTKYSAAHTASLVNEAAKNKQQNLGVVGTACQLTGIANMRSNPLQKDGFVDPVNLVIGLFCTWSLDARKFRDYLAGRLDPETITGMDVPPPPAEVFVVKTTTGNVEFPLAEIRELIPEGCAVCPDMTAKWSDISVGALEGKSNWNTLIIRSERGEKLVNEAVAAGYLELDDFPAESMEHLTLGAGNKQKRAIEKQKQEEACQS